MASLDQIRIDLEGIAHVLADNRLKVPVFQRSYAWEKSHVIDLLQDVTTSLQAGAQEYFLGSIVVSTEQSGVLEVVDGQQRLATVTIILAQIRDYFLQNGEDERAATLERDYLLKRDLRTQEPAPKLTLNDIDNDFFQKTVLSRPGSPDRAVNSTRTSHALLNEASATAAKHIGSVASTTKTPIELLLDYVEYLNDKTKVILLRVPDHANAFTIFETLNDRGLDLAISDLLKNYLFFRAENRLVEVQASWTAMLGALSAVGTDAPLSTMFGITGHHGMVLREKKIYTVQFVSGYRASKQRLT